jgi:Family of unknown function (DUF6516)
MKAKLLVRRRVRMTEESFVELVAWSLPNPIEGGDHRFKYRFAHIIQEVCVLRYDNERGKGDHRHVQGIEYPYTFSTLNALIADFMRDVENYEP